MRVLGIIFCWLIVFYFISVAVTSEPILSESTAIVSEDYFEGPDSFLGIAHIKDMETNKDHIMINYMKDLELIIYMVSSSHFSNEDYYNYISDFDNRTYPKEDTIKDMSSLDFNSLVNELQILDGLKLLKKETTSSKEYNGIDLKRAVIYVYGD